MRDLHHRLIALVLLTLGIASAVSESFVPTAIEAQSGYSPTCAVGDIDDDPEGATPFSDGFCDTTNNTATTLRLSFGAPSANLYGTVTNLVTAPNDITDAAYSAGSLTRTADVMRSPEGPSEADTAAPSGANASLGQTISVSASTDYTFALWCHGAGGSRTFDMGVVDAGVTEALASQSITCTQDVWELKQVTFNSGVYTSITIVIGGGSTWSTGETVYLWGIWLGQAEQYTRQSCMFALRTTGQSTAPTMTISLYENGSSVRAGTAVTMTSGATSIVYRLLWDGGELADISGVNAECYVAGVVGGGSPGNRASVEVGAAEWEVRRQTAAAGPSPRFFISAQGDD